MSSRSVGVGADPLTEVMTRVMTIPLRELYAVLWRVGVVEIVDPSPSDGDADAGRVLERHWRVAR